MTRLPPEPARRPDPSAWRRRAPLVALAIVGCAIAGYLCLYQLGITASVWDPIFGASSEKIITSGVSRARPVPDALLGAFAYLLDAILGALGGRERWRTSPWLVLLFGLVVLGLVVAGLALTAAQVCVFHDGCTLCLCSAAISLTTGALSREEVSAALSYLRRARAEGQTLGQALRGDNSSPGLAA
jgi:uncharacterized membrane protein